MDDAERDRIELVIWNMVKAGLREDMDLGQYRVSLLDAVDALLHPLRAEVESLQAQLATTQAENRRLLDQEQQVVDAMWRAQQGGPVKKIPDHFEEHYPGYLDEVVALALSDEEIVSGLHMPGDPCTSCDAARLREWWADEDDA